MELLTTCMVENVHYRKNLSDKRHYGYRTYTRVQNAINLPCNTEIDLMTQMLCNLHLT